MSHIRAIPVARTTRRVTPAVGLPQTPTSCSGCGRGRSSRREMPRRSTGRTSSARAWMTATPLTTQANALQQAPYNYRASLAGYFAGEAVKVYCPQFSYLLKP